VISVTHLNGRTFVVNAELIKFVEETPDTVITMRDGERVVVKESASDVVERAISYARSVRTIVAGI
jgi:flagellar protein FlbD